MAGRPRPRSRRRSSSRCRRRRSRRSASSTSNRSSRRRIASSWRCASTAVLAAPGFEQWIEGEPLDPAHLLYTADGKPRVVDLLDRAPWRCRADVLRVAAAQPDRRRGCAAQTGTSSLRALLYMDEIAGLLPAGRESAVEAAAADAAQAGARVRRSAWCSRRRIRSTSTTRGCRTSAPGCSAGCRPSATRRACSTGSKARRRAVSIAREVDRLLSALGKRVFLLHNVHENAPVRVPDALDAVVPARSAVARPDQDADGGSKATPVRRCSVDAAGCGQGAAATPAAPAAGASGGPPDRPAGIQQVFLPRAARGHRRSILPWCSAPRGSRSRIPSLASSVSRDVVYAAPVTGCGGAGGLVRSRRHRRAGRRACCNAPEPGATFQPLPAAAAQARNYPCGRRRSRSGSGRRNAWSCSGIVNRG